MSAKDREFGDIVANYSLPPAPEFTPTEVRRFIRAWAESRDVDPSEAEDEFRAGKTALSKLIRLAFVEGQFTETDGISKAQLVQQTVEQLKRQGRKGADLYSEAVANLSRVGVNYDPESVRVIYNRTKRASRE